MIRGMRAGYDQLSGCGLSIFTKDELDQIHYGTLEVLEQAGLMVFSDEAQEIYYSHGCKVDKKKKIVKIPPHVVEKAIQSAPSKIVLYGRNSKNDVILEGTRVNFVNFGEGIKVLDIETGKVRESTKQDVADTALLCDALDNVDACLRALAPRDMPPAVEDLHCMEAVFNNTTKPIFGGSVSGLGMRKIIQMGVAIAGSEEELRQRPLFCSNGCPVSPMQLSGGLCEAIIESARAGIPCNIITMALSGSTTPITLAGTLIVHNVEVLGSLILAQLSSKGAPVIYGSSTTIFDLSCVNVPVGAPELGLMGAAVAKMAQYYNLPSFVAGT